MTTVSSLDVLIGANISGLQRGLNQAQKDTVGFGNSISSKFKSVGDSISGVGTSLLGLSVPIGAALGYGVNVASSFESSMAEISARTGLVGEDLEQIRQYALQMGADTSFSAQQASDAFLQLLSSGSSAEEAISLLPLVLDAAAASGEDLGRTSDVLTDIMAAFGLEAQSVSPRMQELANQVGLTDEMLVAWGDGVINTTPAMQAFAEATGLSYDEMYQLFIATEDAADVVDALARAAGASSADMSGLGEAFANIGGQAKQFGIDVETTAAVLALFAESGIKGAEAGTKLKSMLIAMDSTTGKKALDELGVSMYDAEGNIRDFQTVIGELDLALDGLPMEEQNRLMKSLAGSYGLTGLQALRGAVSIDEMKEKMAEGSDAATIAEARMNTFAGSMDSLMGSVETLMINGLTPFMNDVLRPIVQDLTATVNSIGTWAKENPELAKTLATVGLAVAGLGAVLIPLGMALSSLGTIIGIVSTGFGLLVSAGGALAGALGLTSGAAATTTAAVGAAGVAAGGTTTAMGLLGGAVGILFSPITLLVGSIAGLLALLGSGEGGLIGGLHRAATAAGQLAAIAGVVLFTALNTAATAAQQLVEMGILIIVDTLNKASTAATQLAGIASILLTGALTWVRDRFNELGTTITNLVNGGIKLFTDTITGLQAVLADPLGALKGLFDGVFGWINTNVIQPFVGTLGGVMGAIQDILTGLGLIQSSPGMVVDVANPQVEGTAFEGAEAGGSVGDGFAGGGFTGFGPSSEVAGVVHRKEWVVPQGGALVMRGDSGPTTIINKYYSVSSYGTSPRELLELLKREEASQGAG
jgi:TP901 family phage tail tape measure protein